MTLFSNFVKKGNETLNRYNKSSAIAEMATKYCTVVGGVGLPMHTFSEKQRLHMYSNLQVEQF